MDGSASGSTARGHEPGRRGSLDLDTDVLVIGGGPAGPGAARSAASQGARVVLVDKGGSFRAVVGWGEGRAPGAAKDRSFQLLALRPAPAKPAAEPRPSTSATGG